MTGGLLATGFLTTGFVAGEGTNEALAYRGVGIEGIAIGVADTEVSGGLRISYWPKATSSNKIPAKATADRRVMVSSHRRVSDDRQATINR